MFNFNFVLYYAYYGSKQGGDLNVLRIRQANGSNVLNYSFPRHVEAFEPYLKMSTWHLVVSFGGFTNQLFHILPEITNAPIGLEEINFYYQDESIHENKKYNFELMSGWSNFDPSMTPLDQVHHLSCVTAVLPNHCQSCLTNNMSKVNDYNPREWFLYRYPCFCKNGGSCNSSMAFQTKPYLSVASGDLIGFWPFDQTYRADEMTTGTPPDFALELGLNHSLNVMDTLMMHFQYDWQCLEGICGVRYVRKNQFRQYYKKDDGSEMRKPRDLYEYSNRKWNNGKYPKSLFSYSISKIDRSIKQQFDFTLSFFFHYRFELTVGNSRQIDLISFESDKISSGWQHFFISLRGLSICLMKNDIPLHCELLNIGFNQTWFGIAITVTRVKISFFDIKQGTLGSTMNTGLSIVESIHVLRLGHYTGFEIYFI